MVMMIAMLLAAQVSGQGYARPELLVAPAWLAGNLSDANIRIVDMRRTGYAEGHIPGAVLLDNNAIRIADRPPTFLPTPEEFAALMGRLGITNDTRVIAYDDRGGIYATRLWWILNYYGHTNVAVLDGGWVKWAADKRPQAQGVGQVAATTGFAIKSGTVGLATMDDVKGAINRPGVKLVDARTPAEIEGRELRGIKRGGHIESSVAVYWEDFFDPTTHLHKPAAEIARLFREKGVTADQEVITYCQVGMRASHDLFALALIGHDLKKLRNYYGSWEEWGNRDDTPIKK
ncbi:MAG: sulfurtransferase [Vicinamibacterales bacterium]|nr:sulfurtransferase [Vicinamibacterales bacterium]